MTVEEKVEFRSKSKCELCQSTEALNVYPVPEAPNLDERGHVMICAACHAQYENTAGADLNHWRCLMDSIWSPTPAVKVLSWRMLHRLQAETWVQDLLELIDMDEDILEWAQATENVHGVKPIRHVDAHGNILLAGDTVTLIKDLKVKGTSMVAKRGTAVRRIALDPYNVNHIEGKVNGQRIVILTQYVKKQA